MSKLLIVLLALVAVINAQIANQHNINQGVVGPQDVLLFNRVYTKYGIPLTVRTTDVVFPSSGVVNNAIITGIVVQDNVGNGNGGYPTIRAGGVGQRHVSIRLTSQRGRGTNFSVMVYGRF